MSIKMFRQWFCLLISAFGSFPMLLASSAYVDAPHAVYLGETYYMYADFYQDGNIIDNAMEVYVWKNGTYYFSFYNRSSEGPVDVEVYFEEYAASVGSNLYRFVDDRSIADIEWPVEIIYPQFGSLEPVSPTVMLAGETRTVALTLRNIGQGAWTVSGPTMVVAYTWGSFSNWVELPIGKTVQPGQTVTVNATFRAPNQTGMGYQSLGLYNPEAWRWINNEDIFNIGIRVIAPNGDDDSDGIPNGWELSHGLNPLVNDANGDLDGDGLSNLQEYQQGSDPAQNANLIIAFAVFTPAS